MSLYEPQNNDKSSGITKTVIGIYPINNLNLGLFSTHISIVMNYFFFCSRFIAELITSIPIEVPIRIAG